MPSVPADAGVVPIGGRSLLHPHTWFASGQGRPVAVLVTVMLALFYGFLGSSSWEPVRQRVFDTYQSIAPRQVQALPVVIVDIDEASVTALGQWPWPRTRLARLIEATHRLGARVRDLSRATAPPRAGAQPQAAGCDRPNTLAGRFFLELPRATAWISARRALPPGGRPRRSRAAPLGVCRGRPRRARLLDILGREV